MIGSLSVLFAVVVEDAVANAEGAALGVPGAALSTCCCDTVTTRLGGEPISTRLPNPDVVDSRLSLESWDVLLSPSMPSAGCTKSGELPLKDSVDDGRMIPCCCCLIGVGGSCCGLLGVGG